MSTKSQNIRSLQDLCSKHLKQPKAFHGFRGVAGAQSKYNKLQTTTFAAEPIFQGFPLFMSREILHFQKPLKTVFVQVFGAMTSHRESQQGILRIVLGSSWASLSDLDGAKVI